jgi:hypothetical protein
MRNSLVQVGSIGEFSQSIEFIVMITVQHNFEAALGNSIAKVLYKSLVLVQRMYGSTATESLWHTSA